MAGSDPALFDAAHAFAAEVAELLHDTVADDPPIRAEVVGERVVVAALDDEGETVSVPLTVAGDRRLDLRVRFRCIFDFTGRYLAVEQSEFALILPLVRHPVARFDYSRARDWAAAHVQLHAESSAVGYLRALAGKAPETWRLHLPVGGRRFRPSLEDVVEFAVREFGVEPKAEWLARLEEGRARWRLLQVKSAIRDVIRDDPDHIPDELKQSVDDGWRAVTGHGRA
jgi:hypothetical protein